ncbi:hypothetical protein M9H77_35283 [Catharanthus roseus]|uniref:Uncharacterized protein n=1 Tax=Catharanthus roseus TaxID=4058 RepID=A0ACB9ZNV8_CATRO|nr:hypothetical protein M9H77_35283 [Catharanthus roseus]
MFVTGNENLQDTDTGSLLDTSQAWVLDFKKNYRKQNTEKLKYCNYNNEQDNNPEKEHNRFRNSRCNRMRQIYEIINSEQKQKHLFYYKRRSSSSTTSSNNRRPIMNREQLTVNNREKRLNLYLEILQISDRAPTAGAERALAALDCSSGEEQRESLSEPVASRNGALKLSLSKSTLSSHCSHTRSNESPEGSQKKMNRQAVRKKREEDRRSEGRRRQRRLKHK